jgi:hypothetical protein
MRYETRDSGHGKRDTGFGTRASAFRSDLSCRVERTKPQDFEEQVFRADLSFPCPVSRVPCPVPRIPSRGLGLARAPHSK